MSAEHNPGGGRFPSSSPIVKRDFLFQPSTPTPTGLQPASHLAGNQENDITSAAADVSTPMAKYRFPFPPEMNSGRESTFSDAVPQFAEQFTPLAQKPRKQHGSRNTDSQVTLPAVGQSKAGWFDANEGDLYRGAAQHPGLLDGLSKRPTAADVGKAGDTASVKTTSSSSSSSSGLEIGRRVTQAIDKVGDALHFRRGSGSSTITKTDTLTTITTRDSSTTSSTSDSDTSSSSSSSDDDGATSSGVFRRKRRRRRSVRSKTVSRRSVSPDALSAGTVRRRHIVARREFTLMLPTPVGEDDISVPSIQGSQHSAARVRIALPPASVHYDGNYSGPIGISPLEQPTHDWHGRLITTPVLRTVMDKIRDERKKSGYEVAFQVETEKREARERRKRKRRSHHHHNHYPSTEPRYEMDIPVDRQSSGETESRPRTRGDNPSDSRTRRRSTRNRVEQLRPAQESYKVRFEDHSDISGGHDFAQGDSEDSARRDMRPDSRSTISDIIRPKSASDLLGLKDTITSSSSTSIKSLGVPASRPAPKRAQPFKLPPKPLHRSMTANGTGGVSGVAKPFQPSDNNLEIKKGCWWLDVSCPTWQDLRDLGELLHLHPLTLEDVLQQDPREKIDVFENLGYHFIVFRAIDETYFKYTAPEAVSRSGPNRGRTTRKGKLEIVEDRPGKEGLEGVGVGGLNVYIVVFADGVVSFHNDDISKHIERVREKILNLQRDSASPEWIAHGLLDSIVDAFFPLISHIDDEVDEIDTLVIDPSNVVTKEEVKAEHLPLEALNMASDKTENFELQDKVQMNGKLPPAKTKKKKKKRRPLSKRIRRGWKHLRRGILKRHIRWQIWFNQSKLGIAMNIAFQYLRRSFGVRRLHRANQSAAFQPVFDRTSLLQRMTEMRRLVTGLTRLLGAKHQVIKRLRKRAAIKGGEVGVYISDVQDHIIMLQTSLLHYEYILSHCQPAYMAHLNVTFAIARSGTSDLILALSVVGIGILPLQFVTGLFSTNIQVPHNGDREEHKNPDGSYAGYSWFFVVLSITVIIVVGYGFLVKFWKKQARRKGRMAMLENGTQPKSSGIASTVRRRWESTMIRFRKGV